MIVHSYDPAENWVEFWNGQRTWKIADTPKQISAKMLMGNTYQRYLAVSGSVRQNLRVETIGLNDNFPIENKIWKKKIESAGSSLDFVNFLNDLNSNETLTAEERENIATHLFLNIQTFPDFIDMISDDENDALFKQIYKPKLLKEESLIDHLKYQGLSEKEIEKALLNSPNKIAFLNFLAYYRDKVQISCYKGLLSPFEEVAWLDSILAHAANPQLVYRQNHLLSRKNPKQLPAALPSIEFPEKANFSFIPITEQRRDFYGKIIIKKPTINVYSEKEVKSYLNSLMPVTRPNFEAEFPNLYAIVESPSNRPLLHDFMVLSRHQGTNQRAQELQLILEVCSSDTEEGERARNIVEKLRIAISGGDGLAYPSIGGELKKVIKTYYSKYLVHPTETVLKTEKSKLYRIMANLMPKLQTKEMAQPIPSALNEEKDSAYRIGKTYFDETSQPKGKHGKYPSTEHIRDPSLVAYLKEAQEDYELGCEINDNLPFYKIKSDLQDQSTLQNCLLKVKELRAQRKEEAEDLQAQILELAKAIPEKHWLYEEMTLGKASGEIPLPTLELCLRIYLRNDPNEFEQKLLLSGPDSQKIQKLITKFLLTATEEQRLKRAEEKLIDATEFVRKKEKPDLIDAALQQAASALFLGRVYEHEDYPEMLVFEYKSGMMLQKQQFIAIEDLIQSDQKMYPNVALQRIMGAGKTVVLGTLLAELKADGYHLSLLVPPKALFDTNVQDTKLRSQNIYGKKAETIIFSRNDTHFTTAYLLQIQNTLQQAIDNRDFLIFPPETLQCMYDKRTEVYEMIRNAGSITEKEELYAKQHILNDILNLFEERGIMTLDELDDTMNPKREYNFPLGIGKRLDQQANTLLKHLFFIAATDSEIRKAGLDLHENNQSMVTVSATQYRNIKNRLAEKLADRMRNSPECCSILNIRVNDKEKWESLEKFWRDGGEVPSWVKALGESDNEQQNSIAEHVIRIRLELQSWLKTSWEESANLNYGRSVAQPSRKIVIPFRAAKTPAENSEFSGRWDMINKTYQWYISKGLDGAQLKDFIVLMRNQALLEWKSQGRGGRY